MLKAILIVDDMLQNRLILKEMLRRDYELLEASNGFEALDILRARGETVSAVLLDIGMPGMDGYEVLRRIRSDLLLSELPVIMITGSEDEKSRVISLAEGANDYVTKPYSSQIIKHCLQNHIAFHEAAATVAASIRDRLTGLFSREAFFDRVREIVQAKEPGYYVLASFDIDHFKIVNDQYGAKKGDDVLRHIAGVFLESFHRVGGIASRISADNFAVLYPSSLLNSPELAAIRQRAAHIEGLVSQLAFSIGRYVVIDTSMQPSAMYDRAVLASETVKGRFDTSVAMYSEAMRDRLIEEQSIVSEMVYALRSRQFEVWFQPQYNHFSGALIGAEALVRWRHPIKGLISPGVFIPIFEQNGFIYSLDKFVIEEVCRLLRKWLDEERNPLPVSVNISRYDMLRPDLVDVITGFVDQYAIPRELLRLEVTESAFSKDTATIISVVQKLISIGFTIEIDDFGSGYSSLNTLKDVPAQILKLDIKFLERSADSERGGNIISSVVRMAKWLGMSVIAEGVELVEQADFLKSIGCIYMQGYLFARPMPLNDYEALAEKAGKESGLLVMETVENLNNNTFWDPKSMDTLIFNSYVGAACIFEYQDGHIDLLRASPEYARRLNSVGASIENLMKLDWVTHLDDSGRRQLSAALERSKENHESVKLELSLANILSETGRLFIEFNMRVIAVAGTSCLVYCTYENLTAQREAERKERKALEILNTLMDDAPGGFARILLREDRTLSTEFVNETLCGMRGMTSYEILALENEDASVSVHPDDRERVASWLTREVRYGEKVRTTYRLLCGGGKYSAFNVYGSVTIDDRGARFINLFYTELSLQEKQDYSIRETTPFVLSTIMKSSPNLDFAKDKDFKYICCSPVFARFAGQEDESGVIGRTDFELFAPETAARFRADDMRLFENGESLVEYTEPIPSDDGIQHYSVTSKYVLRDITGKIIGLYGSGRDVTDVRSALDQLQLLTDSIPGGIARFTVSPDGANVTYVNDGFCKMIGCTQQDYAALLKPAITDRVFDEDLPDFIAQIDALYKNGTPINCIFRNWKSDGGYIWVNLRGEVSERVGDVCFVNAVLFDVTSQREAERQERLALQQMRAIMDNAGTGIRALVVSGDSVDYMFANERFFEIQGYTRALYEAEVSDPYSVVHPDDREWVKKEIKSTVRIGESKKLDFRINTYRGETRWVRAVITVTSFESVDKPVQLSVYSDITAEKEKDALQAQLLDNLPSGAGIYELDGNGIKLVYQNKSYWELVGLNDACFPDPSPMSAIHPDDIGAVMNAITSAIAQRCDVRCDVRLRHLTDGYLDVHLAGRIVQSGPSSFLIYATFTPIKEDG